MKALLLILFLPMGLCAQTATGYYEQGLKLEHALQVNEALGYFQQAVFLDPNLANAHTHLSRMLSNRAGHSSDANQKLRDLRDAESHSRRAIELLPGGVEAHFSLIVTLGLQAESAGSPREKIKNAKIIRQEAEKILQMDSAYALAWFVLGKWHHELSKLSWYERVACELFFGGLPEGISMDIAVRCFNRALQLEPDSILFLYGQAIALHHLNRDAEARKVLQQALELPIKDPDDSIRRQKCEVLMKELT